MCVRSIGFERKRMNIDTRTFASLHFTEVNIIGVPTLPETVLMSSPPVLDQV